MNQSAILAAALLGGFGLFIASRDRLPVYARVLWGEKPGTHSAPSQDQQEGGGLFENPLDTLEREADDYWKSILPDIPEIPYFNWNIGQ